MSFLLDAAYYFSVQSFFEEMTCHLAVQTVLAGILPGRIYVGDPASPRTAIVIFSNQHRVYVGGEPSPRISSDQGSICAGSNGNWLGLLAHKRAIHRHSLENRFREGARLSCVFL